MRRVSLCSVAMSTLPGSRDAHAGLGAAIVAGGKALDAAGPALGSIGSASVGACPGGRAGPLFLARF
eukprot:12756592-Heterocapsa_arctica.AAC.1